MIKATRMQESASVLKPIVDGLNKKARDGVRTDQSLLTATWLQSLEEAGCFLPRDGLQELWTNC